MENTGILTKEFLKNLGFTLSEYSLNDCYSMQFETSDIYISVELSEYGALYPAIYINVRKNRRYLQYKNQNVSELSIDEFWKCLDLAGIKDDFINIDK